MDKSSLLPRVDMSLQRFCHVNNCCFLLFLTFSFPLDLGTTTRWPLLCMTTNTAPCPLPEAKAVALLATTLRQAELSTPIHDEKGSSRSSRSSQTSGNSGSSTSGMLARQAAGATSAAHDSSESTRRKSGVNSAGLSF
ncbi:hypothetical protein CBS11350_3760 [Aspergillus niger]|nr:hypothetical protein CBS11350_3760 [Aspergillus niger]